MYRANRSVLVTDIQSLFTSLHILYIRGLSIRTHPPEIVGHVNIFKKQKILEALNRWGNIRGKMLPDLLVFLFFFKSQVTSSVNAAQNISDCFLFSTAYLSSDKMWTELQMVF